jgi:fumarylacetoacetate (FAA) hydrolase family protein
MLERVIEEQTGRSAGRAVRASLVALIGDISRTRPGSKEAARVKEALVAQGAWSQY